MVSVHLGGNLHQNFIWLLATTRAREMCVIQNAKPHASNVTTTEPPMH